MLSYKQLEKNYKNKKVLITGHTGFKGAYLCILLKSLGAKIYGYALKEEKESLYALLKKDIKSKNNTTSIKKIIDDEIYADIRDYNKLYSYINKIKPDYIIHMAAQPLVLLGYEESKYTYEVNVMGTVNLFEAIKNIKWNHKLSILNVTTDKVYENNDLKNKAFKENDKLCGRDPYANSKSCSELVTYAYKKSFFDMRSGIKVSTARAGNVIGGGDFNDNRIIPDCYRAIKKNTSMIIRNKMSIRPYQFVLEPLILYLNIMSYQMNNNICEDNYNIGPDKKNCLMTYKLVELFFKEWLNISGKNVKIVSEEHNIKLNHESKYLKLNNSLIKKIFNYKTIFSNDDMIKYTAKIYYAIYNKENVVNAIVDIIKKIDGGTNK